MPCDDCKDIDLLYGHLVEVAKDFDRHALLLRCPRCATLYELLPEEKTGAEVVTPDEARRRFPGAL